MDLVHSHYVRNLNEGINELDGTDHLYSPAGPAGDQPHWDSKLFDYGKPQVEHFLLSNIKYWLEEYRFDGFRFDGVTSMLYHHHGYVAFDSRDRYFRRRGQRRGDHLSLAGQPARPTTCVPPAVTIAEDVSGMPGICFPQEEGGVGFDYRLGMADSRLLDQDRSKRCPTNSGTSAQMWYGDDRPPAGRQDTSPTPNRTTRRWWATRRSPSG